MLSVHSSEHPAAEEMSEVNLSSWCLRERAAFENVDLDLLHGCVARSITGGDGGSGAKIGRVWLGLAKEQASRCMLLS